MEYGGILSLYLRSKLHLSVAVGMMAWSSSSGKTHLRDTLQFRLTLKAEDQQRLHLDGQQE